MKGTLSDTTDADNTIGPGPVSSLNPETKNQSSNLASSSSSQYQNTSVNEKLGMEPREILTQLFNKVTYKLETNEIL
ncbi:hypothetical protein DPMN_070497 [Dreissena polymorpha]|uniref:Uncharacterized protein n=1 Tax=Dreissena polymorpha TaxID=45954 RepID=A0A9D3Z1E8_DREPO|nr:hypothetical protein DPMN_070497 [Dreissena polymorpha]